MPENDFAGAVIQTHAIHTDRFVHVLPRIAIPCVAVECYSVGFCVIAGKMILYNHTRLFLCRSLLHRRDGNRVIWCLHFYLFAPAQNPHKSQCQSCYVLFFHVVHLLLLLWLQCSRIRQICPCKNVPMRDQRIRVSRLSFFKNFTVYASA